MCYYAAGGNNSGGGGWGIVFPVMLRRVAMRLLKLAVEKQRWDLAAHTIVLATARRLNGGEKPNAKGRKAEKRRSKG
jgi:hypothetical protein